MKIKTRKELEELSPGVYSWLLKRRPQLLDKLLPSKRTRPSLDLCKKDALNYNTRTEWSNASENLYRIAGIYGWREQCCRHMKKVRQKWSLDSCKKEALKYKTKNDWKNGSPNSYDAARKNNWKNKCCKHMPKNKTLKRIINLDTLKVFNSASEASRSLDIPYLADTIGYAIRRKGTAGGYRWAYCDEDGNVIE